ncbi:hypothetical protein HMPREF7215_2267 [Pyramidobacter piscolens W5455]|uniref:Uncharacterized protein n=1 Tax=Pyramidobacter piscolens W5455 TaxID=352165 RepID=A0ABM9ZU11_9BACT|nr:hypothetical protein HMPREF7215_2267 [Pyramidobacter piscolens W5455]
MPRVFSAGTERNGNVRRSFEERPRRPEKDSLFYTDSC